MGPTSSIRTLTPYSNIFRSLQTGVRTSTRFLLTSIGRLLPIPINRTTINKLYNLALSTDDEVEAFLAARAEPVGEIKSARDVVVDRVGAELYEKFFRGYTRKQWGLDPSELDKCVTARIPTRTNTDDRYFQDRHQVMPSNGYTRMFERMLDHKNISIMLQTNYRDVRAFVPHRNLIYTGPVDEFFDYRYGKLPYRSLAFEHSTLDKPQHQSVAVVNYPQNEEYTRITEYKHLTGQVHDKTSISFEYPCSDGDPYYPVPHPESQELYKRYEALALSRKDVTFVGRLATYRYYNMDQVVGQSLAAFRRIQERAVTDIKPVTIMPSAERAHTGAIAKGKVSDGAFAADEAV